MKKLALCLLISTTFAAAQRYDLVIRNGRVIDGTGNPWFAADIGVRDGRIASVGRIIGKTKREIDAAGRIVAPGFIDMHSHSDLALLVDGRAEGKIRQGVTTEILGESDSVFPRCPALAEDEKRTEERLKIKIDWPDLKTYFARLRKQGIAVNVGTYVGQSTVRYCGMGPDDRAPTAEELEKMKAFVEAGMKQGALGLSSGLIYTPGSFAKAEEIIELAKVAAKHGGLYASHIRNESDKEVEAIDEAIRIGEEAKLPVHIFHFKVVGQKNWGRMPATVDHIEAAQKRGVQIHADQYPYIASSTGLSVRLPDWTRDGGNPKLLERLRDPVTRKQIRDEMEKEPYPWERAVIARVRREKNKPLEGKSIKDAARSRDQDELATVFDLLLEENGSVQMLYYGMSEDDVKYAMRQPWVSVGSDGTALRPDGVLGDGKPHPRSYGSFPRILAKYVRDERALSLEDAIRKMTSLPAQQMRFRDRGLLREGMHADVVIFSLENAKENSTFDDPHQFASGMDYVLVNGEVVLSGGKMTEARPGQVLLGPGARRR